MAKVNEWIPATRGTVKVLAKVAEVKGTICLVEYYDESGAGSLGLNPSLRPASNGMSYATPELANAARPA